MDVYGLIGKNIGHSFSRHHFSQKFADENIKGEYRNFDLNEIIDFKQVIANHSNLRGLNVTIPYKEAIIPFLDELSDDAEQIGAVNVIQILNDKLIGHNTDWIGFLRSIRPLLSDDHKNALILGTGGASKAVAFALDQLNISYRFISRNGDLGYEQIGQRIFQDHKIIINCTPLGTFPEIGAFPMIPYYMFTEHHLAYDLIYNPEKSMFLTKAEEAGAKIKNGREMLEIQAEESWKIWNPQ